MAKNGGSVVFLFLGATAVGLTMGMKQARATEVTKVTKPKAKGKEPDYADARAIAEKFSKAFTVPLSLVLSILSIESGFNRKAINKSESAAKRGNAWGIGQVTLATAQDMTKRYPSVAKMYWPKFDGTGESLYDLQTNIALASYYLARMWKRYKGDWYAAGLSYHQGAGTIDKLIKDSRSWEAKLAPKGKIYYKALQSRKARFDDGAAYA